MKITQFTLFLISYSLKIECGKYPKIGANTAEIIKSFGYPVQVHYIRTEDDYILGMQRIPYGRNKTKSNKETIMINHGLFGLSTNFVDAGPGKALALVLADAGYDVWLGNARGTIWSRNHTYLNPDSNRKKFWNFSWHEIGFYDNPAMIDYILKLKKQESLYYIGHSQGTTTFLVMAATRPEYNEKVKIACLLAPSAFNKYNNNAFFTIATQFETQYKFLINLLQIYELPPFGSEIRHFLANFCVFNQNICRSIFSTLTGYDDDIYEDLIPVIVSNFPAAASANQLVHYGQIVRSKKFAMFDYGKKVNLKKYGTDIPPNYNITNIKIPVGLYYGKEDNIVNFKDVQDLAKVLPNVVKTYLLPYKHIDFIYAQDAPNVLFPEIIKELMKF